MSVGVTEPVSSAAAAVIVLLTDPGSQVSVTARFTNRLGSEDAKAFGSNHGYVAIA